MLDGNILQEAESAVQVLAGRRIAVLGYGSQGEAHARNLAESGNDVVVGLRPESRSRAKAVAAGLAVADPGDAVASADIVALLIPDPAQPGLFRRDIEPNLRPGAALLFAHGFNIRFGAIKPDPAVDVVLVAPKSPGPMVRREYEAGNGVPSLIAVHHDATGDGRALALAYAHGLGSARAGIIETSFSEETETDLFGEQAVLCGGVSALIQAGFETLVEAGYQPEVAYFECLHELKLIVDLIYQGGLSGMRRQVSDTAEYGDYVSGKRVIGQAGRQAMRDILAEIRSGQFAEAWIQDAESGGAQFEELRAISRQHPIEEVGRQLRRNMAWLEQEDI